MMNDLDSQIREHLADLVDDPPLPPELGALMAGRVTPSHRGSAWRRAVMAAAAMIVTVGLAGVALRDPGRTEQIVAELPEGPSSSPLTPPETDAGVPTLGGETEPAIGTDTSSFPSWFDIETARPVLVGAGGTQLEAMQVYFATLGRDPAQVRLAASTTPREAGTIDVLDDRRIELGGNTVGIEWRDGDLDNPVSGSIYLRPNGELWDVVAVETTGLVVETATVDQGVIDITIRNDRSEGSFADVLGINGEPVPASPNLDGYQSRGAVTRYGTAAGEGGPLLQFALEVPDEPLRVRAYLVGGLIFGPTEFTIG